MKKNNKFFIGGWYAPIADKKPSTFKGTIELRINFEKEIRKKYGD